MEQPEPLRTTPGWYPDPSHRFDFRYHNGYTWTGDVALNGRRYVDNAPIVSPPQRPTGAVPDRRRRNGLATAALTCGIVAASIAWLPFVFVLGAVLAVLAIVFGAIGLRRSASVGSGRGFAIAGLVTGGVGIAASAAGLGLTIWTLRVVDDYREPADHSVSIAECTLADSTVQVRGSLVNESSGTASYTVVVAVLRPGSRTTVATYRARLDDVPPGVPTEFESRQRVMVDTAVCEIVEVTGPLPFGIVPR